MFKPCIFVSVKTLTLIRHAHAEPGLNQSDIERSLNQIGNQEAEKQSNNLPINEHALLLISPANRTKETAAYWLKKQPKLRHLFVSELYNADLDTLLNCIERHFGEEHLVVIAHNPGITDCANKLSAGDHIDTLPTCGVFTARFAVDDWSQLDWASGLEAEFDYPRNLA